MLDIIIQMEVFLQHLIQNSILVKVRSWYFILFNQFLFCLQIAFNLILYSCYYLLSIIIPHNYPSIPSHLQSSLLYIHTPCISTLDHTQQQLLQKHNISPFTFHYTDGEIRVGAYTKQERQLKIEQFREKKRNRVWRKQIKYDCRKRLADTRPR